MDIVGVDTETQEWSKANGLTPRTVQMEGMSVAFNEDWAEYWTEPLRWQLFAAQCQTKPTTYIFHNAKFDLLKLKMAGLPLPEFWEDTKIAATLVDENVESSLKPLAKRLLGRDTILYKDVDRTDVEAFAAYASNDARYAYSLWPKFKKVLDSQELNQVYELEKAVVPVVQAMEDRGMLLDRGELTALGTYILTERTRTRAKVMELAGEEFEVNSTLVTSAFLYDKLKLKCPKKTKGGARSVDREALSAINHPMADAILEYRDFQKMATTFTQKIPAFIGADGRIHAEFNQLGAKATGRFSCKNPNLQQVPSRSEAGIRLRKCFIAPPGYKLVVADYSQMELRVLAHFSQDPLLLAAYREDIDLHVRTASLIFEKPEAQVDKAERGISKTANFAISYGITPMGLFKRLKALGIQITLAECEDFIKKYFKTYKGVRRFLDRVERVLKHRGFVKSLYGRRRRLAGRNPREVRQAQNFIIQSSAADLCKQALVDVHAALPEGAFIIAMIHDELVIECPEALAEEVRTLTVEMMSRAPDGFRVPIKIDAHIVDRWGDAK